MALSLSASTGCIDAVVTFFDTIEFIVSFGPVGATEDDFVVYEIDPLAESAPHDLRVEPLNGDVFPRIVARDVIADVMAECRGHVLRLLRHGHTHLMKQATPETEFIAQAVAVATKPDPMASDGLSDSARGMVAIAELAIAGQITAELENSTLTVERVVLLLNGTPGLGIALEAALGPMLAVLRASVASRRSV